MMSGQPSRTLLGTAIKRAEHQLLDTPLIFEDPIVLDLVPELADPAAVAEFRSLGEPCLGLLRSFGISLPRLTSSGTTSTRWRPRASRDGAPGRRA